MNPPETVNLTSGNVTRQLWDLSGPMIIGILSVIAFNLADTYFVGQLGTAYLAAMTLTFPVVTVVGSIAMGLGIGVSSVISRAVGEGDQAKVRRLTTDSLFLSMLIVVAILAIGFYTIDPLFTWLGADSETLPLVRRYMKIWYLGMFFLIVPLIGNSAIRATGDAKFPALVMVFAAATNVVLDPLLIFGWDGFGWNGFAGRSSFNAWSGFSGFGLEGAAYATVLSRAMTFVIALYVLHFKKSLLCFESRCPWTMLASWKEILRIGAPSASNAMIGPLSKAVITSFISAFGQEAVAAFGIATRIESLAVISFMALSSSLGPFVGQNWGAGQIGRIFRALKISFYFLIGWGALTAIFLAAGGSWLSGFFIHNQAVILIASAYLVIVPVSYAFEGMMFAVNSTYSAVGQPIPAMIFTMTRALLLYIPLSYLGKSIWGLEGIFLAAAISNVAVGLAAYVWSAKQRLGIILPTPALQSSLPAASLQIDPGFRPEPGFERRPGLQREADLHMGRAYRH